MLQIFGRSAFFDDVSKLSLMSEKFARGLNHEYNKRPKGDDQRQIMDHINSASPALSDRSTSLTLSRTKLFRRRGITGDRLRGDSGLHQSASWYETEDSWSEQR